MNERGLVCFAAVARTGSFSTAAWELSVTQQNVSYSIKKLEDECAFALFVRRQTSVELTAGGERLYGWYKKLDERLEAADAGAGKACGGKLSDTQVRAFLTVVEKNSVEVAAEILCYEPSAVAAFVTELERALGAELLLRKRGGVELTPAGEIYKHIFSAAGEELRILLAAERERYRRLRAHAVIGVSEWLDSEFFREKIPEGLSVELRVMDSVSLLNALTEERVDAALWNEGQAPARRGPVFTRLAAEELCLFHPKGMKSGPVLVYPAWPRSWMENRVIIAREANFNGFHSEGNVPVSSMEELERRLATGCYAVVGTRGFGVFARRSELESIPLNEKEYLLAARKSNGGADAAADYLRYLQKNL